MAGDEDRQHKCPRRVQFCLSNLHDAILLHILSFLPTKSVVATSLLSRRWQHLWKHTPNLQLHESQFNKQRRRQRQNFVNFAERALGVRGGSSLVSFSLSCKVKDDALRINTWITSAVQCKVEQLSLYLRAPRSTFKLPCCIFGCHTLVKLDMETNGYILRVPSSMVCLPRLKHLRLKRFAFVDNKSTEDLLSHPLLEDMIISHCHWNKRIRTVNVNSPNLQSLSIDDFSDHSSEQQVCFIGDNLKSFCYEGTFLPTQYCISGSTMQLREAQILVQFQSAVASESYCKLVKCLSRVQNLTLSHYAVNAFDDLVRCPKMQTTIPVFEHLTQLNLVELAERKPIDIDSMSLRVIFERCPHLEHLNIMTELEGGSPLRPIPSNFLINLKKVTLHSYDPELDDDAIDVLLHSAPALEEMVLHYSDDAIDSSYCSSEVATLERELNRRPKFSDMCRISVIL